MPLGITINSLVIPGTVTGRQPKSPHLASVVTRRQGVRGATAIDSGPHEGGCAYAIAVHGGYGAYPSLHAKLRQIEQRIGEHGLLTISVPAYTVRYNDCTLMDWIEDPRGPLPDIGNGWDEGANCWWIAGVLVFRRLEP